MGNDTHEASEDTYWAAEVRRVLAREDPQRARSLDDVKAELDSTGMRRRQ